ncbi:MAG TPA: hypothetical protein VIV11_37470 [Kofleriaceae bacterium]
MLLGATASHAATDPGVCLNAIDEELTHYLAYDVSIFANPDARRQAEHIASMEPAIKWLRGLLDGCRRGDCVPLADALHDKPDQVKSAAPHFSGAATECAAALYSASCAAGTPQACTTLGNLYLYGAGRLKRDRNRALRFLRAECNLRGGDCESVRDAKNQFFARHIIAVSGYFGFDNAGEDNTSLPLGGEAGVLRMFGDWKSTGGTRGVVFGLGVAGQAEYATGHTRVGANLGLLLWTMKLRTGYVAELAGTEAGRRDLRLELVLSAPWAHAPLRMVFRGDIPLAAGAMDAHARLGFLVELGWNFGLDGRSPRLRDFGFPLAF